MTLVKGDEVIVQFPFPFDVPEGDPQPTAEGVVEGIDGTIIIVRSSAGVLPFPSHLVTKKVTS